MEDKAAESLIKKAAQKGNAKQKSKTKQLGPLAAGVDTTEVIVQNTGEAPERSGSGGVDVSVQLASIQRQLVILSTGQAKLAALISASGGVAVAGQSSAASNRSPMAAKTDNPKTELKLLDKKQGAPLTANKEEKKKAIATIDEKATQMIEGDDFSYDCQGKDNETKQAKDEQRAFNTQLMHHLTTNFDDNLKREAADLLDARREQEQEAVMHLHSMLIKAEEADRRKVKEKTESLFQRMRTMEKHELDTALDAGMGLVICINMILIGFGMDHPGELFFSICDFTISGIFCLEMASKVLLHGFCGHFCCPGYMKYANIFDALLIAGDLVDLALQFSGVDLGDAGSFSLLRIVRLVRLARIIRVLRLECFKDLLMMITGMLHGMPTLMWAVALFLIVLYAVAVICRMSLGAWRAGSEDPTELFIGGHFDTMPRAAFSVFRCSFGDCSSASGTPLFQIVSETIGWFWAVYYSVFLFFVTVGLFNVISAIFVEATMAATSAHQVELKTERLNNEDLWASRMKILIRGLLEIDGAEDGRHDEILQEGFLSEHMSVLPFIELPHRVFDEAVAFDSVKKQYKYPTFVKALEELDINPSDNPHLSDILDPQNDRKIELVDLMDGIQRLRGEPRRSDIVAVDLMVREIQKAVHEIRAELYELTDNPRAASQVVR